MFTYLDNNSVFSKKFGEIICPCCKRNKLYCNIIDKSLINVEHFTCNTCNLYVLFFIGFHSLDYYFDLDSYYADKYDYILFNHRYPYIKRILNNYVKKWCYYD